MSRNGKERLSDVIFDYLQDEDTSPEKLYTDIREEIINALEHFEKYNWTGVVVFGI